MRQIADVDGIERPDGGFLQRRLTLPTQSRQVALLLADIDGGRNGH